MLENIPDELLYGNNKEEDVSIIIGENGCGKSTLLGYLANFHCDRRKEVVGIANTIYDKFDVRKSNFYSLKWRRGRRQTKETIKNALINISKDNEQGLRNASKALEYVGFDPMIGFDVNITNSDFERIIHETELLSKKEKENILSILNKLNFENRHSKIIWLRMYINHFEDIDMFTFTKLFPQEAVLKKLKVIDEITLYLSKDNQQIPLLQASSGELSLISSIVFLSTIIRDRNTIILIDEPENSLHPKWQKEYVKILLDIFHYYQPKIVIATHSPMILNGAEMSVSHPLIFKAHKFNFELQKTESMNIEEIYYDLFNVTTPENRFPSNLLVTYLNQLASKDLDMQSFRQKIEDIEKSIYDDRQFKLISKVLVIVKEITNN